MQIVRKIYYLLFDIVQTLVIAGAIFVVVYAFLFRPFQVNGLSMFPNFENGEYVLTNLITLKLSPLKRGDVVVFHSPTERDKDFIKRIIGLPGDTVELKNQDVYVNNTKIDQSFLPSNYVTNGGAFLQENQQITVPKNEYFVLGDNRSNSSDSREWGFVTKQELIGKSFFVYWPINRFRIVQHVEIKTD